MSVLKTNRTPNRFIAGFCFLGLIGLALGPLFQTSQVWGETPAKTAKANDQAGVDSISGQRMLEAIKYLASDELEGRGVNTRGINLAADYVEKEFKAAGLNVQAVNDSAFQKFTINTGSKLGPSNELQLTGPDGKTIPLVYDKDFRSCSFGGSGKFDAELVFCGYGIDAKDVKYSDYAGIDVKDKVVILMRRTPQQGDKTSPFAGAHGISRYAALRYKVSTAFGKGAKAILFVNDYYSTEENKKEAKELEEDAVEELITATEIWEKAKEDKRAEVDRELKKSLHSVQQTRKRLKEGNFDELMKFGYAGSGDGRSIPIAHISIEKCNELFKDAGKPTLQELEGQIDADLKPESFALPQWKAEGEISVKQIRTEIKNVIGVLEGKGPHADETIVIGAHYDHVGYGGEGSLAPGSTDVHNGADDNASGTVALIALARKLAARKTPLPRRLVFIAFTGEERGLIGSAHYVKNPLFDIKNTVAMLNMDMVGRLTDDKLTVFGTGTAPRWNKLVEETGKAYDLKLSLKPEGFGPSDHSSFYGKEIPVLHLFTGTHSDYHRPSDDWDKINIPGMKRIIGFLEEITIATAENPKRPEYVKIERPATTMRSGNRPYFGSIPDFGGEGPGYHISGASPGSPADKAGLKAGDAIIKMGKTKIGSLDDFDLALRMFSPGEEVDVTVMRDGKRVKLNVKLGKPK
ncbi:M20/M25/M40 family metallo-hydrolase [uncultured Gimesia sp.]|uniref:M20/M25/M40 family metallo-hydrolase n=1 Tax=uncultured Gimesia sp. TaxID=1678688 RepID=UPI0030D9502E|tara:strand:- start:21196 stop:23268 length:2073 start_codon:yes stop_codon:yes gene_type:complete